MVGEGRVNYWVVKPFCYIWVLGEYGGHKLVHAFLMYARFEVFDGWNMRDFYKDFGVP